MRRSKRWWLTALLAAGLALLSGGCDADGDGYDDQTGEPVAQVGDQTETGSAGCAPGGVSWLQPKHCRDSAAEDDDSGSTGLAGCGLDVGTLVCGDDVTHPLSDREWLALSARHEAGHVAVAREFGATNVTARIEPDGDGETSAVFPSAVVADPVKMIAYALAGEVASGSTVGVESDYSAAADARSELPAAEQYRVMDEGRALAERIVAERSTEIDRDAAKLLANGRI